MPVSNEIMDAVREFTIGCQCENPNCRLNFTQCRTIEEQKQKWLWMHREITNMSNLLLGNMFQLAYDDKLSEQEKEEKEEWVGNFVNVVSIRNSALSLITQAMMKVPETGTAVEWRTAIQSCVESETEHLIGFEVDLSEEKRRH